MVDDALTSPLDPAPSLIKRQIFLSPDFSPHVYLGSLAAAPLPSYLSSQRPNVHLGSIQSDLLLSLKDLKSELVELINRDYQDFISLSTNLVGVDTTIDDFQTPLGTIKAEIQLVAAQLEEMSNLLEEKLAQRATVREKKALLQLILSIHASAVKVEEFLGIAQNESNDLLRDRTTVDDGKLIERVAIEYNQLQYLVGKGKQLPFVKSMSWRITRIKEMLTSKLSKALQDAFVAVFEAPGHQPSIQALRQYLRTYLLIDRVVDAEAVFTETIVQPFVTKTFEVNILESSGSLAGGAVHDMDKLYKDIVSFVGQECSRILEITREVFHGTQYDLLVDTLWPSISSTIIKKLPVLFSPGIPEIFHQNYTMAIRFVSAIEALCQNKLQLKKLRAHPAYSDYMKKWQLSAYFQIRFKSIVAGYCDAESRSCDGVIDAAEIKPLEHGMILPVSHALLDALARCWDDGVFLLGLSHRFWRLTLQLLSRYTNWLQAFVDANVQPQIMDAVQRGESSGALRSSTPSINPDVDELVIRRSVCICNDIQRIKDESRRLYDSAIVPRLNLSRVDCESLDESFAAALLALDSFIPTISERVISTLLRRSTMPFTQIKMIQMHYRGTKELPTKSFPYVANVILPLSQFVTAYEDLLPKRILDDWKASLVDQIAVSYASIINQVLADLKKIEDGLTKMRKNKAASVRGDATEFPDIIRLQLRYDVEELIKLVGELGINVSDLGAWTRLRQSVEKTAKVDEL
ncbi:oligomeric golgi complex component, COG2-domain-containing protein [Polychytrium aggregatum]|uniref:oligomeric golgi complex component, COG2-domain-containing protein n=1 Tax=Polychytrium aggregatum TaxID=110093 RepID=UPI0022FF44EB|nr:oligomeric golgi complex component, COG2-domain-containing protein [Polychytrium aggregatum]KAI9202619.1 oligomeric golgi complex component, COG2-domain-containing protein [Polychytrium aggregatum]